MKYLRKLLIIRLSSLGDILLTTPLLRRIKNQYPEAEIDYVVRPEFKACLEHNPNISGLLPYKNGKDEILRLAERIKNGKYELALDLQNNYRSSELTRYANAPVYRFSKNSIKKFLLVNFKINLLKNALPIPERYSKTLPFLKSSDEGLEFYLRDEDYEKIKKETDLIALCPGARHRTKMWPKEYFIRLGKMLEQNGKKTALIGGQSDIELCEELAREIPGAENLCSQNDLYALAKGLMRCSAAVCNDSGMMHLACAVKTPVLAIFGSTVKEFGFTPYQNKSLILENNSLSCRPCSHIGRAACPKGHLECLYKITPSAAYNKLEELLYD